MKTYIVRAIKYFAYLVIILSLIIAVMIALGLVAADPAVIFRNGYNSYWQIALFLLALSFIYPKTGYSTQTVSAPGDPEQTLPVIREVMAERGYVEEKCGEEVVAFRLASHVKRASHMFWEDRITVTRILEGYTLEGLTRDVVRVASALRARFQDPLQ